MSFDAPPMPSSPPPEVLDAIADAARAYDRLTANGVQLHFHVDEETGTVAVHVYDTQGSLGSLVPSQVLHLATSVRAADHARDLSPPDIPR